MSEKFLLFDFDGVIADSFSAAFATAYEHCNHRTEESYRANFEGNIHDAKHDLETGDHSQCKHDLHWWHTFVPRFEREAKMFPGMESVVRALSESYRMSIISSSVGKAIVPFLETHVLRDCFEDILDSETHFSKREKIKMIFAAHGVAPNDCLFITDTLGDVIEAHDCEVGAIGVTWGYNSRTTLERAVPFRIVDNAEDLQQAVSDYFEHISSSKSE